jgi:hypothetical protein
MARDKGDTGEYTILCIISGINVIFLSIFIARRPAVPPQ